MSDRMDEFSTIVRSILKNQPFKYPAITDPIPDTIRLLRDKESEAQLLKVLIGGWNHTKISSANL